MGFQEVQQELNLAQRRVLDRVRKQERVRKMDRLIAYSLLEAVRQPSGVSAFCFILALSHQTHLKLQRCAPEQRIHHQSHFDRH